MMNNLLVVDVLVAIAATSFIALKATELYRALKLGRDEQLSGTVTAVIRCLVGRGRTLNKHDGGLAYMILMAIGGIYIMMELVLVILKIDSPFLALISLLVSIIVLAASLYFLGFSVLLKLRKGYWMDLLPIIALPLIALTRISHYFQGEGLYETHLFYYFAVLFGAGSFPHALASFLNIYYKNRGTIGKTRSLSLATDPLGAATVQDLSWKNILDAKACANCGRCENNCPASMSGKQLSSRKIVQKVLHQTDATLKSSTPLSLHDEISQEEIWACTMCMACVKNCPLYIDHVRVILALRRNSVMQLAQFPDESQTMLRNLELYGNVQGDAPRQQWALDLELPRADKTKQVEYLLWFGCAPEYIPGYQKTIRNMVRILEKAKVSFAVLGKDELCCGDPARRLGEEEIFQNIARKNIERLNGLGVKKIVAMCPHCFNTMKHDYPDYQAEFQVQHVTELLEQLIDEDRLDLKYPIHKKVTLHDPCYLGRVNNLSSGVRKIISAIPGMEFHELSRNSTNSYCCGGGGGQMWLHERPGNRIPSNRVEEILDSGCKLTATACPYCLTMLEAEMKSCDESEEFTFMDVVDMVGHSSGCDIGG